MESVLVICEEPALADALTDALAECNVIHAFPGEAAAQEGRQIGLVVAAPGVASAWKEDAIPVIELELPVRLRHLVYTIRTRLQPKTAALRLALPGGGAFLPGERMLADDEGNMLELTEKEASLLTSLLGAPDGLTREELLREVWAYHEDAATHTLETHVYRLRGKLRQAGLEADVAVTEEGRYSLN